MAAYSFGSGGETSPQETELPVDTGPQLVSVGGSSPAPRHHDDVDPAERFLMAAEALAGDTLEAVAVDGTSQMPFCHCHAQTCVAETVAACEDE